MKTGIIFYEFFIIMLITSSISVIISKENCSNTSIVDLVSKSKISKEIQKDKLFLHENAYKIFNFLKLNLQTLKARNQSHLNLTLEEVSNVRIQVLNKIEKRYPSMMCYLRYNERIFF